VKYWDEMNQNLGKGFECYAEEQARYYVGSELGRRSYIIGENRRTFTRTMHHGASCPAWPARCDTRNIRQTNTADQNEIVGALVWNPFFSDTSKVSRDNVTAISLENNAGLPLLLSGLVSKSHVRIGCCQGLELQPCLSSWFVSRLAEP